MNNQNKEIKNGETTDNKKGGNTNKSRNRKKSNYRGKQGRKDSRSPRINLDNERLSKYDKDNPKEAKMHLRKADNDVSWYSRNPELLKAAASLPFATIIGSKGRVISEAVPGIMALEWAPAFGWDDKYPTAINQAGKSVYSYLVHANSRNYQYEYQDLTIMVVGAAQVFAALAAGIRAYGVVKYYYEQNRYVPEDLVTALGFNPSSLRSNLGNMWFQLNELISRTQQLWIPNTFPVISRWIWMNSNVFTDATGPRAQIYAYKQEYFLEYDATQQETGGGLKQLEFPTNCTWEQYYEFVGQLIDALVNDEDRGVIFGDILNAYGAEKIYSMPSIPSDFMVVPAFSAEVLTQIENATITTAECIGLAQDTDGLAPIWKSHAANIPPGMSPNAAVLNFHQMENPTPEQIAVATRLTSVGVEVTSGYTYNSQGAITSRGSIEVPITCGTELVHHIKMYYADWSNGQRELKVEEAAYANNTTTVQNSGRIMSFDWHPFLYSLRTPEGSEKQGRDPINVVGDFDNYIWLDVVELGKIHDTCIYSLFGLPIL